MSMEKIFRALGERNRLRMVLLLAKGPLNVTELVSVLGISQSNASHHLKLLLDSGVLNRTGRGNWAFYQIRRDRPLVDELVGLAFKHRDTLEGFQEDMKRLAICLARRKRSSRKFFDSKGELELSRISDSLPDTTICIPFLERHLGRRNLVIDVGAGSGKMIPFLLSSSRKVLAVDSSRRMLDLAMRSISSLKLISRVDFRLGEAEHLPVENSAGDAVLMHMLLHHCGDPARAVAEAGRVLAPGGILLVVDLVEHADTSFRDIHGDLWPGFSVESIRELFREAGISPIETEEHNDQRILAAAGMKGERT